MLTLLSALVPSAAALIVGCWVLIEQLGRMRERRVRVALQPERERLTAKYREEALLNPPVDYDGVNARANHDYQQLVELAGVSARRAGRTSSFTDFNVEMEMGPTLPGAEVARQAILLGGATAGVVLLAIAELTKGV